MSDSASSIASLLTLGINASFDPSKLSPSTIQSIISHIKTLKRNGISLDEQSLTINTEHMLDRLKDTKGNLLNDSYKRQIGMTIKRLFPQSDISLQQYNRAHNESRSSRTRASSDEFMNNVRKLRDATLNIIQDVYLHRRIDDLGLYDACIAVLLTLCTSLRIEEIRHLKLSHIPKIQANQPIGIKSKQSFATRIISSNNLLETTFTTIKKQRQYVVDFVKLKKSDYASKYQQNRIELDYIIISTADYMRKKLHEIAASIGVKIDNLGFTIFRKSTTTVLIEGGGHLVAQTMNNHSSLNTTLGHYNILTPQTVQKTYDDLAIDILNNTEIPSAENAKRFMNQLETQMKPSTSTVTNKKQISENKTIPEIISDIEALKKSQQATAQNTNAELRQIKAQINTFPDKIHEQLNRIKIEANKQISLEFTTAMDRVARELEQINNLRGELSSKIRELELHGIGTDALNELNSQFQNKISEIETSCITAQQLKDDYDGKLQTIEKFVTELRSSAMRPEDVIKKTSELKNTLKSNIMVQNRNIRSQISKVSKDLENLKQLFGIDQNEIKELENKAVMSQTETNRKFDILNNELARLREIIESEQPKRKKPRYIDLPFETPPYLNDDDDNDDDINMSQDPEFWEMTDNS